MIDNPIIGKTYAESKEGTPPTPPDAKGAPNILWILLHDAGFGASSAFGGLCKTPNFEKLAAKKVFSSTQATTSESYRL